MNKKQNLFTGFAIIRLIGQRERMYIPISLLKISTQSAMTWLMVWFPKLFIEFLSDGQSDYVVLLKSILVYIGLLGIVYLVRTISASYERTVTNRFAKAMRKEIGSVTMKQPFWVIESSEYREKLSMASNIGNILGAVDILESIIEGVVTSLGLAALLAQYDWKFCILVMITLSVKVLFVRITVRYTQRRRILYAQNDKVGNYLTSIAYNNPGAAKEIRVNNLADWFLIKIKAYRNEMLAYQYRDFKVYAMFDIVSAAIMAGQTLVVLISLAGRAIAGDISIADFTMYFSAITTVTTTLSGVVSKFGDYSRQKLDYTDFTELYKSLDGNACLNGKKITPASNEICFENVSFMYPNTDRYVLHDINVTIPQGEKLSIVGLNGAGKSTLVKLLCKFYKPSSGRITVGGVDIWDIDNCEYYKLIGAVFQDYVNFAFSIKENIILGNASKNLQATLKLLDFKSVIDRMPKQLDTSMSRAFDSEGVNLSGGEEQKVAILRSLYKGSPITLLDEPTRALDARTEAEMYENFFRMMKGKTAIYISHRLASSKVADNILVLVDGKVDDYGTHNQLMKNNGIYAEMYRKQSEAYSG